VIWAEDCLRPISGPKSISSFQAGTRASGNSSTPTTRPTRMSTASNCSQEISAIRGSCPLVERGEDPHPVEQEAGREEPLPGSLLARAADAPPELGVLQDLGAAVGGLVRRVDEVAVLAVNDLQRDAADVPGHGRPALPERFGHGQAEALADRLLHDHVGL